jgi:hypothetical protein
MDGPDTTPLLPDQAATIVADLFHKQPRLDARGLAQRLAEAATRLRPRFPIAATKGDALAAALLDDEGEQSILYGETRPKRDSNRNARLGRVSER